MEDTQNVERLEIFALDARGAWTGERLTISAFDGAPAGWCFDAPPEVPEGKMALRFGPGVWELRDFEPLPAPPAPRRRLPKLTLVDRLQKAGKLEAAIAALGTGATRIRWDASSAVDPSNPDVRTLLTALVGAEQVDAFLAPETKEEAAL